MKLLDKIKGGWRNWEMSDGAAHVADRSGRPSGYAPSITTDGVGKTLTLASGTNSVLLTNLSVTAANFVVGAFGVDATDAIANLTVAGTIGTTGFIIPANTNAGGTQIRKPVPKLMTVLAVITGVSGQTPKISIVEEA